MTSLIQPVETNGTTGSEPSSAVNEFVIEPLHALWRQVVAHLPSVATAIVVLVLLWVVARLARRVLQRVLAMTKLDASLEGTRISSILEAFKEGFTPSLAIAYLAYLSVLLLAWTAAAEIVGLGAVRRTFDAVLGYVPRIASAMLVVLLGGYLASVARRAVEALLSEVKTPYARMLEGLTEALLLIVVGTLAINVLGVDVSIITSNLTVLLTACIALVVFLLAWAMRRPAEEIIANYYLRRLVRIGDTLTIGERTGTVVGFAPIGVVLRNDAGAETLVPARHVLQGVERRAAAPPPARNRG